MTGTAFRHARLPLVAVALLAASAPARAQKARITITGGPIAFAAPTITDFDNGSIALPSPITFTVEGRQGNNDQSARTTIVSIRASTATLFGTVPVSDLQWRRADLPAWNSLSISDANVEARPFVRSQLNDPWSNQIFFRLLLSYATDEPGTYKTKVVITLTATTP